MIIPALQIHGMQQENGTGRKPLGTCHKKLDGDRRHFPALHFPPIRGYGECTIKKPKSLLYHMKTEVKHEAYP